MSAEHKEAKQNAAAWLGSIREMIEALGAAEEADDNKAQDAARQTIEESAVSVEIRDDWKQPGAVGEPAEYKILLTTGGPALRIIGEMGQYNQPENARLEWQDWFTPWTEYRAPDGLTDDSVLLAFARQFYFGD
jgi:hypothetical protein